MSFTVMMTASPSLSATIEARSGTDITSNFVIAGFGPLPPGLDAQSSPPTIYIDTDSNLAAPDAVPDSTTNVVINGITPDTPSIFFESSNDLRNAFTEGSNTNVNHTLYQVIEFDEDADGTNDVSERGASGTGQAQSRITTQLYATNAASSVDSARTITFINNRADAFNFGIQGLVEMDVFAEATGVEAEAQASATLDFFFETAGALNIVYAPAGPFTDTQEVSGPNAATNLDFETAIAATGRFTMFGTALAHGSTPGCHGIRHADSTTGFRVRDHPATWAGAVDETWGQLFPDDENCAGPSARRFAVADMRGRTVGLAAVAPQGLDL